MAESYNPADYGVEDVNDYLAGADEAERRRVLEAERGEKARVGILDGPHGSAGSDDALEGSAEGDGLAGTGNSADMSTKPDAEVSANIGHQEGAPADLVEVADESAAVGYFGQSAEKPDYSQANPSVMNQEG